MCMSKEQDFQGFSDLFLFIAALAIAWIITLSIKVYRYVTV